VISGKKIVVVLPAFNAAQTLVRTIADIPGDIVDEVVLVDDASTDNTVEIARSSNIHHIELHKQNQGYGANQKTCYKIALDRGADIVVLLHPDYQYTPMLIPAMTSLIAAGVYHVVLGSRILGNGALKGGMPVYKYVTNRALTFFQNLCTGAKLSEYHTGYRAFSREALEKIEIQKLGNSHIFDNEMLSEIILAGYSIGEVSCPTRYFAEASSLDFGNSVLYGLGVIRVSLVHLFRRFFG
jgi:glycosyltransferase involved in cell wall biosynthesis